MLDKTCSPILPGAASADHQNIAPGVVGKVNGLYALLEYSVQVFVKDVA